MPPHAQAHPLARDVGLPYNAVRMAWNQLVYYGWSHEQAETFIRQAAASGNDLQALVSAAIAEKERATWPLPPLAGANQR